MRMCVVISARRLRLRDFPLLLRHSFIVQSSRSTNSREGRSGARRYGGLALGVVRGPGAGAEKAAAERLARRHQTLSNTGEPTSVALVTPALRSLPSSWTRERVTLVHQKNYQLL